MSSSGSGGGLTRQSIEVFSFSSYCEIILYNTVMTDTSHNAFVKIHTVLQHKSEP